MPSPSGSNLTGICQSNSTSGVMRWWVDVKQSWWRFWQEWFRYNLKDTKYSSFPSVLDIILACPWKIKWLYSTYFPELLQWEHKIFTLVAFVARCALLNKVVQVRNEKLMVICGIGDWTSLGLGSHIKWVYIHELHIFIYHTWHVYIIYVWVSFVSDGSPNHSHFCVLVSFFGKRVTPPMPHNKRPWMRWIKICKQAAWSLDEKDPFHHNTSIYIFWDHVTHVPWCMPG